jgi:hypothetical protein
MQSNPTIIMSLWATAKERKEEFVAVILDGVIVIMMCGE